MGVKSKIEAAEMLRGVRVKSWLVEAEAAAYLSISPATLRKWRESGRIGRERGTPPPCFKRGSNYYYSVKELDEWVREGASFYKRTPEEPAGGLLLPRRRGRPRKNP